MADTKEEVRRNLVAALEIQVALGLVINNKKSVFQPTYRLNLLGFRIDSWDTTLSLPCGRLHSLKMLAAQVLSWKLAKARLLAKLLGMMVATHLAILPAPLHFCNLGRENVQSVRRDPPYEAPVQVSPKLQVDLQWWINKSQAHNVRPLQIVKWDRAIETDASLMRWGACCEGSNAGGT